MHIRCLAEGVKAQASSSKKSLSTIRSNLTLLLYFYSPDSLNQSRRLLHWYYIIDERDDMYIQHNKFNNRNTSLDTYIFLARHNSLVYSFPYE